MSTGRNAPCPCGSGKKYKKCCLMAEQNSPEALYRRISHAYNILADKLMQFTEQELSMDVMDVALDAFFLRDPSAEEQEPFNGFSQLFVPWALFTWTLAEDVLQGLEVELALPPDTTIAECYAQRKGRKLEALERQIIDAACRRPLSFYEIITVQPGEGFTCQDVFTHATRHVLERSASTQLKPGDLFFCSIARLDAVDMLVATAPMLFSPSWKPRLEALRSQLLEAHPDINEDVLRKHDPELRKLFHTLREAQP